MKVKRHLVHTTVVIACLVAGCAMDMAADEDVAGTSEELYNRDTLTACLQQKYERVKQECCSRFDYSDMMTGYCAGNAVTNCQDGHFQRAGGACRDAIDEVRVCAGMLICSEEGAHAPPSYEAPDGVSVDPASSSDPRTSSATRYAP